MNFPFALAAELPSFRWWRRAAATFLIVTTMLTSTFSPAAAATPQASTIVAIAKIREAWVQNLRTKQLEPILKFYASDAVFLQPNGDRITIVT